MLGTPGGGGRAVLGEKESHPGHCAEERKFAHHQDGIQSDLLRNFLFYRDIHRHTVEAH